MPSKPRAPNQYQELFLRHPQPMWVYEVGTLRFLAVNDAAIAAYGFSREEFLDMTTSEIRPHEDRAFHRSFADQVADATQTSPTLWRHKRKDGFVFYADVMSNRLTFKNRRARLALAMDATARLAVGRALSESRAALAEAQELANLGSWESDLRTQETVWSAELYRMLGVDPLREDAGPLYRFDHPEDAVAVRDAVEAAKVERVSFNLDHRIVVRDGRIRHVHERGRFFYDENGVPYRAVGAVLDITERKHAEEQLVYLAEHDALTGLPNRKLLQRRLEAAMAAADVTKRSIAVLFADLDRFKGVNDTIAHAAGDRLLQELASRLTRTVRIGDTVGRPSGDEFVAILDNIDGPAEAHDLARRILIAVAQPFPYEKTQIVVSASIGVAQYPGDGNTPDELIANADAAMYVAKFRGGNTVEAFRPEMRRRAERDVELERALRVALDRETLEVAYQPIVDARTGALVSLEALARWNDGERSVDPVDFIPLAETTGLIVRLGSFVLWRACREMRNLIALGWPDLAMCVNISARQLRDPGFPGVVSDALRETNLPARNLRLEITESAYISGNDAAFRSIGALEALGIRMSIDDFGTGYSALGYLKRLPVDALKIDQSFVADIIDDPADQTIVRAIIAVADQLGLAVIAEGVETEEQAEFLRACGCTQLQGFLFGRPLPAHELERDLRSLRVSP